MVSGNYLAKQFSGKISPAMKPSRRTSLAGNPLGISGTGEEIPN